MRTVKEVSNLTGVSIRALHHYDAIGLLRPTQTTESGYRLYDDRALEKLQIILLFRELRFPLKEIKRILENPTFDRAKALEQQIQLLTLQKERMENLIDLARRIQREGVKCMLDFQAFDTGKIEEYTNQAKARWGNTGTYQEFEEKSKLRTPEEEGKIGEQMMEIFREFGTLQGREPQTQVVQEQVQKLRNYITEHYYECTPEILGALGKMYVSDGSFTERIDKAGGVGTAEFAEKAIQKYILLQEPDSRTETIR